MFEVNVLNVSLWFLVSILVLVLIGVIIWRAFFDNKSIQDQINGHLKSLQKKDVEMLTSLSGTSDINFGYNVLVKNKFVVNGFTLIPGIVHSKSSIYIILKSINTKRKLVFSKGQFLTSKNKIIEGVNYKKLKEIKRFLAGHDVQNVKFIVPVFGSLQKLQVSDNENKIIFVEYQELENFLKERERGSTTFRNFEKIISLNVLKNISINSKTINF